MSQSASLGQIVSGRSYDPVRDGISLEKARGLAERGMTLVGGTNALSLSSRNEERIREETRRAMDILGPTNRFWNKI